MVSIIKNYIELRRKSILIYGFIELSSTMSGGITRLFSKKDNKKKQIFINHCENARKTIVEEIEKGKIHLSNRTKQLITQLNIAELRDCEAFREILFTIFKELREKNRMSFLMRPVFFYNFSLNLLELLLLCLLIFGIGVYF